MARGAAGNDAETCGGCAGAGVPRDVGEPDDGAGGPPRGCSAAGL
jgi:hypothetical protein